MINAQQYWMAPHALRDQIAHGIHVVQARKTRNWYRTQLTIR